MCGQYPSHLLIQLHPYRKTKYQTLCIINIPFLLPRPLQWKLEVLVQQLPLGSHIPININIKCFTRKTKHRKMNIKIQSDMHLLIIWCLGYDQKGMDLKSTSHMTIIFQKVYTKNHELKYITLSMLFFRKCRRAALHCIQREKKVPIQLSSLIWGPNKRSVLLTKTQIGNKRNMTKT